MGDNCDIRVFDMPGFDRLDYRTAKISESTLRSIDGIIVTYDSISNQSQSKATKWIAQFNKVNGHRTNGR